MFKKLHFVIPFFTLYFFVPFYLSVIYQLKGDLSTALWLIILTVMGIIDLGYWYEWHQFINPYEVRRHGGYFYFIEDSRDDVKMMWKGILGGIIIGLITYWILSITLFKWVVITGR